MASEPPSGGRFRSAPRCVNPVPRGALPFPHYPAPKRPTERVPFLDRPFAVDPESLAVWELSEGSPLPETDGVKVNYPWFHLERPNGLCLSVTRACNLACRYCFVMNRPELREGTMTPETALKAIKLCDRSATSISFFGGEPLLQFEMIKSVVEMAEWMCELPTFHLTTNATLIDDAKAEFLEQHGVAVLVSLDGPPEIHNRNRPLAARRGGRSSYELTMAGLETLRRHGLSPRVTVRSTYTKECPDIAAQLEHLNDLCDQGFAGHVAVEPVSSSEASCVDPRVAATLGFTEEEARGLWEQYRRAFRWALDRVKARKRVRWHHLNHFAWRVVTRNPSPSECGAGKGYIGIDPQGRIFACHREPGQPIGHVDLGVDEQARAIWLENRLHLRRKCPTCWCRFICGGGCRAESLEHEEDYTRPYGAACVILQMVIAQTIELLSGLTDAQLRLLVKSDGPGVTPHGPA